MAGTQQILVSNTYCWWSSREAGQSVSKPMTLPPNRVLGGTERALGIRARSTETPDSSPDSAGCVRPRTPPWVWFFQIFTPSKLTFKLHHPYQPQYQDTLNLFREIWRCLPEALCFRFAKSQGRGVVVAPWKFSDRSQGGISQPLLTKLANPDP